MIRRSIAGFILGPALLVGSVAWSGFLALRTVFDPDRSSEVAEELLDNDEVQAQLTENLGRTVEAVVPAEVGLTSDQVEQIAADVLADPAVEELILSAFASTHGAFLGEGDAPQTLDLTAAAAALRASVIDVAPQSEALIPESPTVRVTLPTDRIPDAGPIRRFLQRTVPILSGIAIVGSLIALLTTSDRSSVLTRAGIWALSATAFFLVLGFGVPWLLIRFAPEQAQVLGALTTALLRTTLIPSLVLALCGAALVATAIMWPSAGPAAPAAETRAAAAPRAPRGPAWPGPVPQPLVYPEPDSGGATRGDAPPDPARSGADPAVVRSADPDPARPGPAATQPAPRPRVDDTVTRREAPPPRPQRRREPAAPVPDPRPAADRPPPLPTVASVSRPDRADDDGDPAVSDRPETEEPRPVGLGPSGRLPTKEQAERSSRWRKPTWVEGHGWVLDPDDPKPPPANARHVEGVGWVVPGPPPDRS